MTTLFKGHSVSCEAKGWAGTSVEAGRPVRLMQESRRNTTVAVSRVLAAGMMRSVRFQNIFWRFNPKDLLVVNCIFLNY